ncbi:MAG: nucleotidyltransferase domain-containing protein [Nanoarchaeota archaeon]|nr:nucleotidyltransferase domain-containing protein [Nanoarchaeota archaeon]MBU1622267.1 nucleotidyltransferase domain-containing protein [Nanoarchaeota archaeon]MBU1974671.1 nucleotidyltransferase domain-containing protein [Nanoarchaeota archaeon]
MLRKINNLHPFFEDCYRRINVREYAKIIKVSPPTASKLLYYYFKEKILKKKEYRNFLFFYADKSSKQFVDLSRLYWSEKLEELVCFLEKQLTNPTIVLFGSLSKGEIKEDSDIDLAIFALKKKINLEKFEGKLGRKVQLFWFKSIKEIKSEELANNVINGVVLNGRLKF